LKPAKWKPDYQPHLDSIVRKASEAAGDTIAILTAALDAFFADSEQQRFGCIPPGLDWKWDQFAGPYLEQTAAEERKRKREAAEQRYQEAKRLAEAEHMQKVRERAQRQEQNGQGPMADPVAELMRSIGGGKL
jgi:hypothetical protein